MLNLKLLDKMLLCKIWAMTCVTTTKFLGVMIDHKFKWNDHIT